MAPRKPPFTRNPPLTPQRKSARGRTADIEPGPAGTTTGGRTKGGLATPVRSTDRADTAGIGPASVGTAVEGGQLGLARSSGEPTPTRTYKRGRTGEDQNSAKAGKKARTVSFSYLFHESINEADPLPG